MQYKVQWGDTLSDIAKKNNTTVAELVKLNNIANANKIYAGDTINLPDAPSTGVSGASGQANEITGITGNGVTSKKRQNIPDDAPDWLFDDSDIQPTAQKKPNANTGGTTAPTPNYNYTPYDPMSNPDYQNAMSVLQQAQSQYPVYINTYEQQIQDIYNKIMNREDFSYDLNGDMLYQQYKDQAVRQGQLAMRDTMGQAAALTGGYGSSYGQSVGQQQYDAYLQNLNDVVPELYGMAYDRYAQEGQDMLNDYQMVTNQANDQYAKYRDEVGDYWNNLSFLQNQADTAYNRGYDNWYTGVQFQNQLNDWARQDAATEYERSRYEDETSYNRRNDAYDRLLTLITSTGYMPTAEEMDAAGMSQQEAASWQNYYQQQLAAASAKGGSGGGGGSKGGTDATSGVLATMLSFGNDIAAYDYLASQDLSASMFDSISALYDQYKNASPQDGNLSDKTSSKIISFVDKYQNSGMSTDQIIDDLERREMAGNITPGESYAILKRLGIDATI
jgi:LysM repeat protein